MICSVEMKTPVGAVVGEGDAVVSRTRLMCGGVGVVIVVKVVAVVGMAKADVVEAERRRSGGIGRRYMVVVWRVS